VLSHHFDKIGEHRDKFLLFCLDHVQRLPSDCCAIAAKSKRVTGSCRIKLLSVPRDSDGLENSDDAVDRTFQLLLPLGDCTRGETSRAAGQAETFIRK
jgi:hypothetical protein